MVEIRYGDQYEVTDLAGQTVNEAREQFKSEFGIPEKANARLNGSKVKSHTESDTVLNDDDRLTFAVSRSRTPFLVGALLLALAVTGSVFAFGFINASTTLTATTVNSNFADVTVNTTGIANIGWSAFGFFKGSIAGPNSIFNITPAVGYTGDLVTTVTLGNADQLVKRYRQLSLQLQMVDATTNATLDINESGAADANDWVMLTLDNGSVSLFTNGGQNMAVRVKKGFYITHVFPFLGWSGSASPELFCEVAQR
jgi:molybdopterin converting factor small subunit